MRRQLLCGLAALAACGGNPHAAREQGPTPTIEVVPHVEGLPQAQADADALAKTIESLSSGRVMVEVHGQDERCRLGPDCVAAVQDGRIDVYQATVEDLALAFPELQVLDVPYLFESDRVIAHVFGGPFSVRLGDAIRGRTGLRLMAMSHGGGWRGIANTVRPIRGPDDLGGLIFRTSESPIHHELVRALGAVPRIVPWMNVSNALETGVVQGTTLGILEVVTDDPGLRVTHLTLDRHSYRFALWVMNEASFQALPAAMQQVVTVGFDELRRLGFSFPNARETDAMDAFRASGGQLHLPTPAERRAFVMAAGRVSTWFMDTHGPDWLVWLEEAIAEAERQGSDAP